MIHIVYHAGCNDGFGAAWAAYRALGDDPEKVRYHPTAYTDVAPLVEPEDTVYIFDFSFPREILEILYEAVDGRLTLWDHHESAMHAVGDLSYCHFDMDHSGAYLAWQFFASEGQLHPDVPILLLYVEDRDLWKFELPDSKEVNMAMQTLPHDFKVWDDHNRPQGIAVLKFNGMPIWNHDVGLMDRMMSAVHHRNFRGEHAVVINTPVLQSDVCDRMLQSYPSATMAVTYYEKPNDLGVVNTHYSLRSRQGSSVKVNEIAALWGGGGHPQAAGFSGPLSLTAVSAPWEWRE